MSIDCYCDYDPPQWHHSKVVTARKQHRCEECRCIIHAGERYEYVAGSWDGCVSQFRTCKRCLEIRCYVQDMVPCFCWAHSNLHEDARNAIEEYAHELPGLWFGWARRQVTATRYARETRRAA